MDVVTSWAVAVEVGEHQRFREEEEEEEEEEHQMLAEVEVAGEERHQMQVGGVVEEGGVDE